jgi:hypothetical protein
MLLLQSDKPADTVVLPASEEWILPGMFFDLLLSSNVRSRYFTCITRGLAVRAP